MLKSRKERLDDFIAKRTIHRSNCFVIELAKDSKGGPSYATSGRIASGIDLSARAYAPFCPDRYRFPVAGSIHRKHRGCEGRNSSRTDGSLVVWFMSTYDGHMLPVAINLTCAKMRRKRDGERRLWENESGMESYQGNETPRPRGIT